MQRVALTVDLEEWYHGQVALGKDPPRRPKQAVESTLPLLDLFRRRGVRATFFTVGEVVLEAPDLMERVAADGHEVGCHGFSHRSLRDLGARGLRRELGDSLAAFRRVLGPAFQPLGFRAPLFSIDKRTPWALPLLCAAGYRYDSSIFPMRTPLYGSPGAPVRPYRASTGNPEEPAAEGGFPEYPAAIASLGPLRLPAGGGVYFRFLPPPVFSRLLRRAGDPASFYLHPWETNPATPRVEGLSWWHSRLRHHGYGGALSRLDRLLEDSDFSWSPMAEVLGLR
jgi:peptidoglycan-N-acetylglucosamine deacetylase